MLENPSSVATSVNVITDVSCKHMTCSVVSCALLKRSRDTVAMPPSPSVYTAACVLRQVGTATGADVSASRMLVYMPSRTSTIKER